MKHECLYNVLAQYCHKFVTPVANGEKLGPDQERDLMMVATYLANANSILLFQLPAFDVIALKQYTGYIIDTFDRSDNVPSCLQYPFMFHSLTSLLGLTPEQLTVSPPSEPSPVEIGDILNQWQQAVSLVDTDQPIPLDKFTEVLTYQVLSMVTDNQAVPAINDIMVPTAPTMR